MAKREIQSIVLHGQNDAQCPENLHWPLLYRKSALLLTVFGDDDQH